MTYEEALNFIHSVSWKGSVPGLERIARLLHLMGDPQKKLRFIHLAGTNGKGSTSALLSNVLTQAGYRVGLCTSPYITCFEERMQIDGVPISREKLAEVTEFVSPFAMSMEDRATEFETVCAITMEYFAREKCDIVVLETGMGGRLDATNVIEKPECAVITNIGLDHTQQLGETVELIALEKAGIIKPGAPTVIYEQQASVIEAVAGVCREKDSELTVADFGKIRPVENSPEGQRFAFGGEEYDLPLLGAHQLKNAAVALTAVEVLRSSGWHIPESAVKKGLAGVKWPARFEIISRKPWFVVDGGHNPQCAETVAENIKTYFPDKKMLLLVGILKDKDFGAMTDILSTAADGFVTVTPDNPRALPSGELAAHLEKYGKPVYDCGSVAEGVRKALALAARDKDTAVCAVGSLYMAGEIRLAVSEWLRGGK